MTSREPISPAVSTLPVPPSCMLQTRSDSPMRPVGRNAGQLPRASVGHNLLNYLPRGCFPGWPLSANFPSALEISEVASSQVSPPSALLLISSLTRKYRHTLSVIMTIGSPALAAYSLVITARNVRMVKKKARSSKHKASKEVGKALISLQQQPYNLADNDVLLLSIPNDDHWRKQILERLGRKNGWSLATASTVTWVVIAFIFTFIGSFISLGDLNGGGSDGLAVGTLWLWLLCLVVCWLRVPIYSSSEIGTSIHSLNKRVVKYINEKFIKLDEDWDRKTDNPEEPENFDTLPTVNVKVAGDKGEEEEEPKSNPSSAIDSPHGVGGIQSVQRSPTNIGQPAGAPPDARISTGTLHPDTDKLLIPFTNTGWLHSDEARHPPTFNYSRNLRYHVFVDDVFRALNRPDLVGISGKCPMTEIVSPIFNRNWGLTSRTPSPPPRNMECFLGGRDGR